MIEKDLSITVLLYINITKYRLKRERDANFNSFIENYSCFSRTNRTPF